MTFVRKFSGDRTAPIVAVYTCPDHGEFDAEVMRDENGEAPDAIECQWNTRCQHPAAWTPSPVAGRVRRIEVTRGGWQKPERKTFLDTRELGEGQDIEEFRAKRRKMWRDVRMDRDRKEFLNK